MPWQLVFQAINECTLKKWKKILKSYLHCLEEDKTYSNILNGVEHQYLF